MDAIEERGRNCNETFLHALSERMWFNQASLCPQGNGQNQCGKGRPFHYICYRPVCPLTLLFRDATQATKAAAGQIARSRRKHHEAKHVPVAGFAKKVTKTLELFVEGFRD